jgi:hypothetical protein
MPPARSTVVLRDIREVDDFQCPAHPWRGGLGTLAVSTGDFDSAAAGPPVGTHRMADVGAASARVRSTQSDKGLQNSAVARAAAIRSLERFMA